MRKLTKIIPVWIKEPIWIFLNETGKVPLSIAFFHAACDYADTRKLPDEQRRKIYSRRHQCIMKYLRRRYGAVIDADAQPTCGMADEVQNAPIWVFWWQGMDAAPELVKICIQSLIRNSGNHPVIVVDQWNYHQYVQLPEYIIQKQQSGIISLTHFSDILRVNLLAEHGGFWCDATVYCTKQIPEEVFSGDFFTCRNPGGNYQNVSDWNWSIYAMSCKQQNLLMDMVRTIYECYWNDHAIVVDYFLTDYLFRLVYDRAVCVQKMIDRVPANNVNQTFLQDHFGEPVTDEMKQYLNDDETWLYKVSWKAKYPVQIAEKETLYGYWIRHDRELNS